MPIQPLNLKKSGLDHKEWQLLKKLNTPAKIQDFLNSLKFNFEKEGETNSSVSLTLKRRKAQCFEGALLAAAALWVQGQKPLLLDLKTIRPDFDHVVALFREGKCWGAISKTNHAVLRYREPVYKSAGELAMSYFHEYFLPSGKKTLRNFSKPFDLSKHGTAWLTTKENLTSLAYKLDHSPHTRILSSKQIKDLRKADPIEIKAGEIREYL
ncbi:MAG: hypothetical protein HYT69_00510 [Candidatus Zambryskibacteria bacterium]|nr:hypothetical protein [Candidatus Zambryskibacteria bacterium]